MTEPLLSDQSLILRAWREADAAEIVECIDGDTEITKWLDQVPQPYTLEDARAYIGGLLGEQAFAITDAGSGGVVGSIGFGALNDGVGEIGYWIRAEARGSGVATRALVLVSRWALRRGDVARVQLRAEVGNVPSRRVAEKAGFQLEGVLRSAHWSPRLERRVDWAMYSLLPSEIA